MYQTPHSLLAPSPLRSCPETSSRTSVLGLRDLRAPRGTAVRPPFLRLRSTPRQRVFADGLLRVFFEDLKPTLLPRQVPRWVSVWVLPGTEDSDPTVYSLELRQSGVGVSRRSVGPGVLWVLWSWVPVHRRSRYRALETQTMTLLGVNRSGVGVCPRRRSRDDGTVGRVGGVHGPGVRSKSFGG